MKKNMPKVMIVMLNWNQLEKTSRCLQSIRKIEYPSIETVVIDNGSTDNSPDRIEADFPEVRLIRNGYNCGCAGGRNIGIRYFLAHDAEFLFIADNDLVFDSQVISELVEAAEKDERIGIVGPHSYFYDQPDRLWQAGGGRFNAIKGKLCETGWGERKDAPEFQRAKEVDAIPGATEFIRRAVFESVDGIDERFFIYYEDTDFCLRVKKAGFKLITAPRAKVWHDCSSSLGMESPAFYYYRTRNRLLFMRKNFSGAIFALFLLYFMFDFSYSTLLTLYLSKRRREFLASVNGVLDFFKGNFGKKLDLL